MQEGTTPITEPPWLAPTRRRGRPPTLSRDRVIAAAVGLVQADGFDRLTLRRLANELGSGATSVYWHVRDKGQLLDLVIDELIGRIEIPEQGDPVAWLTAFARSDREVLSAYPGLAELILERGGAGPNGIRQAEAVLAVLSQAGVPDRRLMDAYHTLLVYVNGFTIATTATTTHPPRAAPDVGAYLQSLPPASISMLTRAGLGPGSTAMQRFDYGLAAMLKGLLPE